MDTLRSKFSIDGIVDTKNTVMDNINRLCTAAGCWMSYDTNSGLWSVIINQPETSKFHFDDSNILGAINVSGKGINEYYNKVTVQYPNADLRDQTDYVDMKITDDARFPQEIDNTLQITMDCINNSSQAMLIGSQELKQNRVDKLIEFRTDFSAIGLKAGDVITITHDYYGFNNKLFRINKIVEDDADDGTISLSISAFEYDTDVYNNDLEIVTRDKKTGIVPKSANAALTANDANAATNQVASNLFNNPEFLSALASYLQNAFTGIGLPKVFFENLVLTATSAGETIASNTTFAVTNTLDTTAHYIVMISFRTGLYDGTINHPMPEPGPMKNIVRLYRSADGGTYSHWAGDTSGRAYSVGSDAGEKAFNAWTIVGNFQLTAGESRYVKLSLEHDYSGSYSMILDHAIATFYKIT